MVVEGAKVHVPVGAGAVHCVGGLVTDLPPRVSLPVQPRYDEYEVVAVQETVVVCPGDTVVGLAESVTVGVVTMTAAGTATVTVLPTVRWPGREQLTVNVVSLERGPVVYEPGASLALVGEPLPVIADCAPAPLAVSAQPDVDEEVHVRVVV